MSQTNRVIEYMQELLEQEEIVTGMVDCPACGSTEGMVTVTQHDDNAIQLYFCCDDCGLCAQQSTAGVAHWEELEESSDEQRQHSVSEE